MGLLEWYFLIGIVYTVINGYVRKLEADWDLTFAWLFLWPVCFIALFVIYISKRVNKF